MTTVKELQKRIVKALETGQDPAPIVKELGELRAKIAAEGELADLQKIANERQALRDKAEAIKAKVRKQNDAIDSFLKARDTLVSQLQPLIEPMKELAKRGAASWEREPGDCFIFNDIMQYGASVNQVKQEYLPADFGCPFLEMKGGEVDAMGKAREAYNYFMASLGILSAFQKGISILSAGPGGEFDGDLGTEPEEGHCIVCSHAKVETINNLLRQGNPLRDIESEYAVSRSSLSRHKNNCLNLGAIRMRE